MLSCVLEILHGIIAFGNMNRNIKDEKILKSLLYPLQVISFKEKDLELSQNASKTASFLLTRSSIFDDNDLKNEENLKLGENAGLSAVLLKAVDEYFTSAEPHLRALGVHTIMTNIKDSIQVLNPNPNRNLNHPFECHTGT
jgi:hypothetical protein